MGKSPDAFRTISEVADWLGIQAHVLRFWESKFTQVKPIKRAGGRRYYRPADMQLLGGIQKLLHEDGLTIKGVQKILREEGMSHVAALSPPLDELTLSQIDDVETVAEVVEPAAAEPEKGVVLDFDRPTERVKDAPEPVEPEIEKPVAQNDEPVDGAVAENASAEVDASPESATPPVEPEPEVVAEPAVDKAAAAPTAPTPEPEKQGAEAAPEPEKPDADPADDTPAALPAFLRRSLVKPDDSPAPSDNAPAPAEPAEPVAEQASAPEPPAPEPEATPTPVAPKPRVLDIPPFTAEKDIAARPATLTAAYKKRGVTADTARDIAPLLERLSSLRDSMAAQRRGANSPAAKD